MASSTTTARARTPSDGSSSRRGARFCRALWRPRRRLPRWRLEGRGRSGSTASSTPNTISDRTLIGMMTGT
eukprot:9117226-Alexandrium_andersonii.AAC.1